MLPDLKTQPGGPLPGAAGAACPACGGTLGAGVAVLSSEPALIEENYYLRRCGSCGSAVTVGAAPPELYESGAYQPRRPRLHRAALPLLRMFDRHRLSMIGQLAAPPARLLDVGAGRGRFVASARGAGYHAIGIEPNSPQDSGSPVQRESIEQAEFAAGEFDVVVMWHVLEHLERPGEGLERVGRWLRPGGALLVGVPNFVSLQARIGAGWWFHLDVPRHRVHFTPDGLDELLRRHGFSVVRSRHLLIEHNQFGMWQTLVNRATSHPSYLYNLLKHNAPVRSVDLAVSVAALSLAPVAGVLELAAGVAGRGGTISVLAQREG
jgi:SAM-dependent methyltransferase